MRDIINLLHPLHESFVPDSVKKAAAAHLLRAFDDGYTSTGAVLSKMFEDGFIDTFNKSEESKRGFRTKLRDWCYASVDEMSWTLGEKIKGGTLPVWRAISAPADWKPDPKQHPGLYWTWDKDAAEAHWGNLDNDNVVWLLYAHVTTEQINWPVTLSKNCMPDYEDEKEIEVNPLPINIMSYTIIE